MKWLMWNLVLAVVWTFLQGSVTLFNALSGLLIGFLVLSTVRRTTPPWILKVNWLSAFSLLLFFLRELVVANIHVAWLVLRPGHHIRPGIVALPLDTKEDMAILLLANLITLTPGTLSLDVSPDKTTLYVYTLDADNAEQFKEKLRTGMERKVQQVFS